MKDFSLWSYQNITFCKHQDQYTIMRIYPLSLNRVWDWRHRSVLSFFPSCNSFWLRNLWSGARKRFWQEDHTPPPHPTSPSLGCYSYTTHTSNMSGLLVPLDISPASSHLKQLGVTLNPTFCLHYHRPYARSISLGMSLRLFIFLSPLSALICVTRPKNLA